MPAKPLLDDCLIDPVQTTDWKETSSENSTSPAMSTVSESWKRDVKFALKKIKNTQISQNEQTRAEQASLSSKVETLERQVTMLMQFRQADAIADRIEEFSNGDETVDRFVEFLNLEEVLEALQEIIQNYSEATLNLMLSEIDILQYQLVFEVTIQGDNSSVSAKQLQRDWYNHITTIPSHTSRLFRLSVDVG